MLISTAVITFILFSKGVDAQWNCSALDTINNHYTLPDLNYGDDQRVASNWFNFRPAGQDVYLFPPTLNCSGTVSAVKFCYAGDNDDIGYGRNYPVFMLLTLEQNDLTFRITDIISVQSVPTEQMCTDSFVPLLGTIRFCCDIFQLNMDQFRLPSSNFAFAIISGSSPYHLRYSDSFSVERYNNDDRSLNIGTPAVGNSFTVNSSWRGNAGFRLFQFIITPDSSPTIMAMTEQSSGTTQVSSITSTVEVEEPNNTTEELEEPSSAEEPTTTEESTTTTDGSTERLTTTEESMVEFTIPEEPATNEESTITDLEPINTQQPTNPELPTNPKPPTTPDPPTTPTKESTFTTEGSKQPTEFTEKPTSTRQPTTARAGGIGVGVSTTRGAVNQESGSSNLGPAIGAAVGGGVAFLLLLAIIIIVLMVVLKRRTSWKPKEQPDRLGGISYKNAIYGAETLLPNDSIASKEENVNYDYAGAGPHVYSDVEGRSVESTVQYEQVIENEHSHSYALIGAANGTAANGAAAALESTYESVKYATLGENQEAPPQEEGIYMIPGSDENTLYAQLEEITTDNVTRSTLGLGGYLGAGQFGTVYKGVWQSSTRGAVEVAVKTLNEGSTKNDKIKFLQEAAIMGQFKHPNVVEMYGVITEGEPILLVLEMLKKGDLRDYLLKMRPRGDDGGVSSGTVAVDNQTLLNYCHQVASGMAYLSSKAFVHRDLAARNILVSDGNICKIADFGMSRDLMDESYYVSHGGKIPVKWTAPEALHYKKYSTASDVWSYGALMYEIWSVGHKPFENLANVEVIRKVDTGYRLPPPPGCPRALYNIMIACWHPTTFKRPSFKDVSSQLSSEELLKWTEEDRSTHPDADKLGADLDCAQDLYPDLQALYKRK